MRHKCHQRHKCPRCVTIDLVKMTRKLFCPNRTLSTTFILSSQATFSLPPSSPSHSATAASGDRNVFRLNDEDDIEDDDDYGDDEMTSGVVSPNEDDDDDEDDAGASGEGEAEDNEEVEGDK